MERTKSDYAKIGNVERRTIDVELRYEAGESGSGRTIEGYAALTEVVDGDENYFLEVIDRDAFKEADLSDVRALFNHNPDNILARTASNTLTLEVDEKGLKYRFEAPDTTLGNDLLKSIKRGDISQSSFSFTIMDDRPDKINGKEVRRITRIGKVYDIAPVTYPFYQLTTSTARALWGKEENNTNEALPEPTGEQKQISTGATPQRRARDLYLIKNSKKWKKA